MRAGRKEWIGLAVIALPSLVYSMDLTVLNLALPALSADLQPSSTQLLWIVDIYGFLVAGSLVTMGTLGDRIGRRRVLMFGAAAFAGASVLAAFATSAEMLIAARALLGVAGGTLAPSTLSLIRVMFTDPPQRTLAVGIWITSYSAGAAIGPLAGGAMLEVAWWGSVFLLGVPVMVALLVLGPRLLPEYRDPNPGRVDLRSVALSLSAVLTAIYGLKVAADQGVDAQALGFVLVGTLLAVVFARRQRRLEHPLIDLDLFRVRAFSVALTTQVVGFFALFGAALFLAQYLQSVLGLSPLEAGVWTVPEALGFIVSSMLTPALMARVRPASVIAGGLAVGAAGFALIAQVDGTLAPVVAGSVLFALGLGAVVTVTTDIVVSVAPAERAGAASAISETSSELGAALGIAILGAIATAVYRAGAPDGAGETIGAVTDPALVEAARAAFTDGLQVASSVAAVVLLVAAVVAAATLRGARLALQPAAAEV
ncbi:MAG TPA: MFS transporter [Solirubrobacteraceae bacterium]